MNWLKLKLVLFFEIFIILLLLFYPFNRLFGTSYYFLIKVIFVLNCLTLIIILYLILTRSFKDNEYVKGKFKLLFFVSSVFIVTISGLFHIFYIKTLVIPNSVNCTYYDEYNYKLYFSEGTCKNFELIDKKYDENELIYLAYKVENEVFYRYYENKQVVKTIEHLQDDTLILINKIFVPIKIDEKIVETNYFYDTRSFKQTLDVKYIANGEIFLNQNGSYEAIYNSDVGKYRAYDFSIDINKKTSYEFIENEKLKKIFTDDYLFDILDKYNISSNDYINELVYSFSKIGEVNFSEKLYVVKPSTEYFISGYNIEFSYVDENIQAWHVVDSGIKIRGYYRNDLYNIYYDYKKGVLSGDSYVYQNEIDVYSISCEYKNGDLKYCDRLNQNLKKEMRYLVTTNNKITKVESYNLIEKSLFEKKEYINILKIKKITPDVTPFGDYITSSEIIETPKPYLKIK